MANSNLWDRIKTQKEQQQNQPKTPTQSTNSNEPKSDIGILKAELDKPTVSQKEEEKEPIIQRNRFAPTIAESL